MTVGGTLGSFFLVYASSVHYAGKITSRLDYQKQLADYQKTTGAEIEKKCEITTTKPIAKVDPVPVPPEIAAVDAIPELRSEDVGR